MTFRAQFVIKTARKSLTLVSVIRLRRAM